MATSILYKKSRRRTLKCHNRILLIFWLLQLGVGGNILFAQVEVSSNDTCCIEWKERRLQRSDFRYTKMPGTKYAVSATSIRMSFFNLDGKVILKSASVFIFDKSNTNIDSMSSYNVAHEQLHFDITEYFRRKFMQEIILKKLKSEIEIKNAYDKISEQCNLFHDQYDLQTSHGQKRTEQLEWKNKIERLLDSISLYAEERYIVPKPEYRLVWPTIN